MLKVFRYAADALFRSYIKALLGMAATLGPLLLLSPTSVIVYILIFLFVLFFCYGIRTIIRQLTRLELSTSHIREVGPMTGLINRGIAWEELGGFKLRYYSTRRDREAGWMHLVLKGKGVRLSIDSHIGQFEELVRFSYAAAVAHGIKVDPLTGTNLAALGIDRFEGRAQNL